MVAYSPLVGKRARNRWPLSSRMEPTSRAPKEVPLSVPLDHFCQHVPAKPPERHVRYALALPMPHGGLRYLECLGELTGGQKITGARILGRICQFRLVSHV